MTQSLTKRTLVTQRQSPILYRPSLLLTGKHRPSAHPVSRPGNVHFPRNRALSRPYYTSFPPPGNTEQAEIEPPSQDCPQAAQRGIHFPNMQIKYICSSEIEIDPGSLTPEAPASETTVRHHRERSSSPIPQHGTQSQRSHDHSKVTYPGSPSPQDRSVAHDHPPPVRSNHHHHHHTTKKTS